MDQLVPRGNAPDAMSYLDRSSRPVPPNRPWVMVNMIMSADGAYAAQGRSGPLSSDADREMFHALRAAADVVLVGAGTARTEKYRRPETRPQYRPWRREQHMTDHPRLAVVSREAQFPSDQPFRSGVGEPPLVFRPQAAISGVDTSGIELFKTGSNPVDSEEVLRTLSDLGHQVVLCEGGPSLLGQLCRDNLLDELFLTISPILVGGEFTGILGRASELNVPLRLNHILEGAGTLLLNYRVDRD